MNLPYIKNKIILSAKLDIPNRKIIITTRYYSVKPAYITHFSIEILKLLICKTFYLIFFIVYFDCYSTTFISPKN